MVALLGFLLWLRRRPLRTGTLFLIFVAGYGTGRVIEDFFRIDETHGLGLSPGQWFSAAAVLTAGGLLLRGRLGAARQDVAVDSTQNAT